MPLNTGLRIARARPSFLGHHGPGLHHNFTLVPTATCLSRKQLGLPIPPSPPRRPASSSSQPQPAPLPPTSTTLNPPATTRPPPLLLPTRGADASLLGHWYRLGKAYTDFYKGGLRAIFTNRKLARQSPASSPVPGAESFPTRSELRLRERVRHDLSRLPAFALLLLVCGELTPLAVLLFPRLTPYTCRIPRQEAAIRRAAAARRDASFRALRHTLPDAESSPVVAGLESGHVCRSLGLTYPIWDRVGFDGPFAAALARRAVQRIAADDAMVRDGGGVGALVDGEVVLACEDRGIDVGDRPVDELRGRLEEWLRRAAPSGGDGEKESAQRGAEDAVRALLLGLGGRI
ncbi:hypothetical protein F4804DRAFT_147891 [Jackrogersella minutella]|nr:hypothetical protein F4804DRAFT_147891 [Jackrogersella minutella]